MTVLEFSYRHKLAHLSSTLSAYPIIAEIYKGMGPENDLVFTRIGVLRMGYGQAQDHWGWGLRWRWVWRWRGAR